MNIFILYTILYFLSILGIITIALLVVLRRKTNEYKSFAVFAFFLSLWLLLQFLAQLSHQRWPGITDLLLRITVGLPLFFSVLFYAFTKFYTKQHITLSKHLIVPIIWGCLSLIPGLVIQSAVVDYAGITLNTTILYYLELVFVAGYIGAAVKLLLHDARHSNISARRYRAKFLIFSILQAFVIIMGAVLFLSNLLLAQLVIPFACLIMVALFAYTIIKHQLFDIRLVVTRALAYILSLGTIAVVYSLLAFVLAARFIDPSVDSQASQISYISIALALALTFGPLKRFFDKITRAVFYQDAYDTQQVLDDISSVLVRSVSTNGLVHESVTIIQKAVKSDYIKVIIMDGKKTAKRTISVGSRITKFDDDLIQELANHTQPILVLDEVDDTSVTLAKKMQESGVAIVARLEVAKEHIGYMVVGHKASGNVYNSQDVNVIKIVADELAVAIQSAIRFEEIEGFNERLQGEIETATKQLMESNRKLLVLDQAKDEFISMASHQLRTPLTTVKGYLSMVLEGDAGDLSPTQRKLLDEAYASSQRMVGLISDFLNVSRLKTGKFILEPSLTLMPSLITEEIEQLKATADSRELKLVFNPPANFPPVRLDGNKIRQVIMNFIDNAIYYSRAGGTINIELTHTAKEICFKVKDQGIGVPADERHHLFTKFYRATNARKARPDGTGIGLFMAKKVVIAHGGSIIFETTEGKGSTFGFCLPMEIPKEVKK